MSKRVKIKVRGNFELTANEDGSASRWEKRRDVDDQIPPPRSGARRNPKAPPKAPAKKKTAKKKTAKKKTAAK